MAFPSVPPLVCPHSPLAVLRASSSTGDLFKPKKLPAAEAAHKRRSKPEPPRPWNWQADPVQHKDATVAAVAGLSRLEPTSSAMRDLHRSLDVEEDTGVEYQGHDPNLPLGTRSRFPLHSPNYGATTLHRQRRKHGMSNPPQRVRPGVLETFPAAHDLDLSGTASFTMNSWRGRPRDPELSPDASPVGSRYEYDRSRVTSELSYAPDVAPAGATRLGVVGSMAPDHYKMKLKRSETLCTQYHFRKNLNQVLD